MGEPLLTLAYQKMKLKKNPEQCGYVLNSNRNIFVSSGFDVGVLAMVSFGVYDLFFDKTI